MKKQCVLYDRDCIDCGECDMCDLDPNKRCDDCGRCIDEIDEYRSLNIKDYMKEHVSADQINRISKKLSDKEKKKDSK